VIPSIRSLFTLALLLTATGVARAQGAPAAIAPLLDDQTLIVARVDLGRIDVAGVVKLVGDLAGDKAAADQLKPAEEQARKMLQALTQAGVSEVYAVVSLADFPKEPLFVAAPVKPGHNPKEEAAELLREILKLESADAIGGLAIAGKKQALERLKTLKPAPLRPEFVQGFAKAGDSAAQIVLAPSDDVRRVLREMLPRLPDEVGGGSGRILADVRWAALSVQSPPKLALNLTIQSRDADSAAAQRSLAIAALGLAAKSPDIRSGVPKIDELARLLAPQIRGDQLTLELSAEGGGARQALEALAPAVQSVRTAAGRQQSVNNLKQIMLAMHNYHDVYKSFPPQAIRSKEGKPLLSWRVALLPYLNEQPLYQQFHLDEPWDSAHNKPLIEKMPALLASPALGEALRAKGMTSYLVPLSKQPPAVFLPPKAAAEPRGADGAGKAGAGEPPADAAPQTVFDLPQGTQMILIHDGTSNTIGVVEAHPKSAVIWTKPDDLLVDPKTPAAKLTGQPGDTFAAALCDGSARTIKTTIDPKTLLHLFQMDDGQPIGEF